MKTLLIDNYDSFTYNLFQLLGEVNGEPPDVVHNDAAGWDELARGEFDNVVISPGPGRPDEPADFGVCADAIRRAEVPLLGVCLGHQGLCQVLGARVERAPEAVHGRSSAVIHDGSPLFAGIPREFQAVRYHSLRVDPALPDELEPLAWTSDGILMAVAHRTRPLWGVQFHPESVSTEHGRKLLANFRDLTAGHATARPRVARPDRWAENGQVAAEAGPGRAQPPPAPDLRLLVERVDGPHDAEHAFTELYADSSTAFWLDSAKRDGRSRFSFMGDDRGPLAATITYDVGTCEVRVTRRERVESDHAIVAAPREVVETRSETIFDYLRRETLRLGPLGAELPFDFACGFAGYLGYELKADCGGERAHESALPDAAFVFADRMLAFDHELGHTYLLCLTDATAAASGGAWIAETASRLDAKRAGTEADRGSGEPIEFTLARSRERYLDDIAVCKERLLAGETYEVCLTNQIAADFDGDALELYRRLRRVNPAPFAAYLRFGDTAVLSSSPERFLRLGRDRWIEAKPIKGTAPRGRTPAEDVRLAAELRTSEKNRAENLMIADLLRNDLGRVCQIGTVHVPHLMQVESYETVHQLVSTVRGLLREGLEAPDAVRACFPPGSMTGAPKKRTMEIVDELEYTPRGVYSGAIGYFGLGGSCDLSVTIRTIVVDDGSATIGVGGAIVTQSDPDEEYEEALLKGAAPMRALDPGSDGAAADAVTRRSGAALEAVAGRAGGPAPLDSSGCPPPTPRP